jgi:DNA-binding CsgD family transcriptional regulator
MSGASPPVLGSRRALLGREHEREALDGLLDGARAARGGVLVIHGEAGVGKTALLEYAVEAAPEFRIARTVGVEAEMELPFAAAQQLCAPFLDLTERLPQPQHDALDVAFGLSTGPAPNEFLVGLAVLGLLAEVAEEQPLLCVVDDAQWLDSASARALAFVGRRLLAEKIALVFATRELGEELRGLPDLEVRGLGDEDASALLSSVVPSLLDEQVRRRIVSETRGNPLALLELPRGLTPAQLAGGLGLVAAGDLAGRIEESFARRLEGLSDDMRLLLLLAAADPVGDPLLLWRAAEKLGISAEGVAEMETDGLLTLGEQVTFRHPLVRSAVYGSAPAQQRRAVHSALAQVTDRRTDADRRAWHLAAAASAPDEEVASELERSAGRAQARGGLTAAAAFLERSSALTLDLARRAARALAAAEAKQLAGALEDALALVSTAEAGPLDEVQRAQVDVLRARISLAADRGREAPRLLLTAAKRLESLDGAAARGIYLDALTAAFFAGRLGGDVDMRRVAAAARAAPAPESREGAADLLLDGLVVLITDGAAAGTPVLRKAVSAFTNDEIETEEGLRWLWLAGRAAMYIWDYENTDALTQRQVRVGRESGALTVLPVSLSVRASVELWAGNLREASSLIAEENAITDATDGRNLPYAPLALAAFRGREPDASRLIHSTSDDFFERGEGMGLTLTQWATALLNNGLARYDVALAAADQAAEDPHELWFSPLLMVELVEAATRSGQNDRAASALEVLSETTGASGTPWAQGIEARSRALLVEGQAAEALYREAIEQLRPTQLRVDLARARLLYGEWLRRQHRHEDARGELRIARDMFNDFGMEAFAERTHRELQATGERPRRRTPDTRDQLTPQERQIARLAAEGCTNREIAAQLFISPNTVDYHLRKVFRKLDVKWRTQLVHRLQ